MICWPFDLLSSFLISCIPSPSLMPRTVSVLPSPHLLLVHHSGPQLTLKILIYLTSSSLSTSALEKLSRDGARTGWLIAFEMYVCKYYTFSKSGNSFLCYLMPTCPSASLGCQQKITPFKFPHCKYSKAQTHVTSKLLLLCLPLFT